MYPDRQALLRNLEVVRFGPACRHGDLVRAVDTGSLFGGGTVAAEFADLGQPPDTRAGAAFRHAVVAAHHAQLALTDDGRILYERAKIDPG
jgi:hypothetical protein